MQSERYCMKVRPIQTAKYSILPVSMNMRGPKTKKITAGAISLFCVSAPMFGGNVNRDVPLRVAKRDASIVDRREDS